jgi:hypothetical protein
MKHPEEVLRDFKKADEEVLQQSDLILASFIESKSLFVERFPQLDDPFAAEWGTANDTARKILPDYASLAHQSSETDALLILMDQGRNLYQMLLLYVQIAFPGDAAILKLFGQPQYAASSRSQLKLPILLRLALAEASKPENKTALIAKGMKEAEIDSLETLAENIVNQTIVQEKAMKARTRDANKRIIALNLVWEKMSLVCHCAKLVFQNDATRYNLFLLSDKSTPAKPAETPAATPTPSVNNQ